MDAILVVNAGSSSVKFQVFGIDGTERSTRLIRGQIDGIGTEPRLRAGRARHDFLVDQTYPRDKVSDVPTAMRAAAVGFARHQKFDLARCRTSRCAWRTRI